MAAQIGYVIGGGIFAERTNPVAAVAAYATATGFRLAEKDAAK